MSATPLDIACKQIEFARRYTWTLLDGIPDQQWFEQPAGVSTHIAWQVGHLAMAEYGLCLFRMRGRNSEDMELMSSAFRKRYSRGSTPDPDPEKNPSPQEIRDVLNRVHDRAMRELPLYTEADLRESIEAPYTAFDNKLGGLLFCSHHEMIHAGQLGLLRRMLGCEPVR